MAVKKQREIERELYRDKERDREIDRERGINCSVYFRFTLEKRDSTLEEH